MTSDPWGGMAVTPVTTSPARMRCSRTATISRWAAAAVTAAVITACTHQSAPPPSTPTMQPPGPHASPAALAVWIKAGTPVNPKDFHTVSERGTTTALNDPADVAFRPPGTDDGNENLSGCATAFSYSSELNCLPGLRERPPKPDVPGEWISGWVTFDGAKITVGSLHGDPGPFNNGVGKPLNYGDTITFGDFQCRSDPTGIYCVSRSHHSGLAMSTALTPFGCVRLPIHPRYVGEQFMCGGEGRD
jgi:hypothetical protein